MNIDQLRKRFPDEDTCRSFFESILWKINRCCPHCYCLKSYRLSGDTHNNTAELFNAMLERAKQGVFHYLSKKAPVTLPARNRLSLESAKARAKIYENGRTQNCNETIACTYHAQITFDLCSRPASRQICKWRHLFSGAYLMKLSLFIGHRSEVF